MLPCVTKRDSRLQLVISQTLRSQKNELPFHLILKDALVCFVILYHIHVQDFFVPTLLYSR